MIQFWQTQFIPLNEIKPTQLTVLITPTTSDIYFHSHEKIRQARCVNLKRKSLFKEYRRNCYINSFQQHLRNVSFETDSPIYVGSLSYSPDIVAFTHLSIYRRRHSTIVYVVALQHYCCCMFYSLLCLRCFDSF